MKRAKVMAVLSLAAAQLAGARAVSAACDLHNTVPDGRFTQSFSISSGTNELSVFFFGKAGRSYSAEVMTLSRDYGDGTLAVVWGGAGIECPTVNIAGLHATGNLEPTTQLNPFGTYFRASFTAPSDNNYVVKVSNTSATSALVRASVSDTTAFNPLWSTFGGFETFYRMVNTINGPCTAKLTLTTDAGAVAASKTIVIPAGSAAPTANTGPGDMNVADNTSGFATITHDCSPGAIEVDGFLGNYTSTPASVLPIKVHSPREAAH